MIVMVTGRVTQMISVQLEMILLTPMKMEFQMHVMHVQMEMQMEMECVMKLISVKLVMIP